MDDEAIFQFTAITSATPEQAERYLQLTDGNLEQAIQLYFEDPSLGAEHTSSSTTAPRAPETTSSVPSDHVRSTEREVIQIDSDDDSDVQMLDEVPVIPPDTADDAEMARRLQEEMYGGATETTDIDDIRAPMARTRETLVGGADYEDMTDADMSALIQQQILGRQRRANGSE
jgi:hypothetical protein